MGVWTISCFWAETFERIIIIFKFWGGYLFGSDRWTVSLVSFLLGRRSIAVGSMIAVLPDLTLNSSQPFPPHQVLLLDFSTEFVVIGKI